MDSRFESWMVESGGDTGSMRSSLSTVRRVESAYGDLDVHYERDRCESILAELTYSKNDERVDAPNPSTLTINGDLYTGLASIRTHLGKYIRFLDGEAAGVRAPSGVADVTDLRDATEMTFSLERDLQTALRRSIGQLEPGLEIIDGGGEYTVPSGRIDILARDQSDASVVIELKSVKATRDAVAQTLAYMGDLAVDSTAGVRGILVAPEFDPRAEAAARVVPTLKLMTYAFTFTFSSLS